MSFLVSGQLKLKTVPYCVLCFVSVFVFCFVFCFCCIQIDIDFMEDIKRL